MQDFELGAQLLLSLQLLVWLHCIICQPRHPGQLDGGSVYRGRAHSEFRGIFCLERKTAASFTDTSLALKVVNSWGQGGRHSWPGDDVVLVTAFTGTLTGFT